MDPSGIVLDLPIVHLGAGAIPGARSLTSAAVWTAEVDQAEHRRGRTTMHAHRDLGVLALGLALLLTGAPSAGQNAGQAPARGSSASGGSRHGLGPGTVFSYRKIGSDSPDFRDALDVNDWFGKSVVSLGDLDGDGVDDLAVGASNDRDGDQDGASFTDGAIWVLFMRADRTVGRLQKIEGGPGFRYNVGFSLARLGDVDGDGVVDLATGVRDGALDGFVGGVFVLFLERDGTVRSRRRIGQGQGGFTGQLNSIDFFGDAVAGLGDLDGDGIDELAVGAWRDDDGAPDAGAVWILFLGPDGRVRRHQKISRTEGGLVGDGSVGFGRAVAGLGDLDGDGVNDLAVGTGYANRVWVLQLNPDGTVARQQVIDETQGGFTGLLEPLDQFGDALAGVGDLDGDGVVDLLVGTDNDEDRNSPGGGSGSFWVLLLRADGTVKAHQKVGPNAGGLVGPPRPGDRFGTSLCRVGDLDGDGAPEIAVGALGMDGGNDDQGGFNSGGVRILSLAPDGRVQAEATIQAGVGGLPNTLDDGDRFGFAVARIGDLDGDGTSELAAGAPSDDDGNTIERGAVWVLFPDESGAILRTQKISATRGGLTGGLQFLGGFGSALTALGDLDGDGLDELAVGAPGESHGGVSSGAVLVLRLTPDGTVASHHRIHTGAGGFTGVLGSGNRFGSALARVGDLDGDGVSELAVGASGGGGSVWVLSLRSDGTVRDQHEIGAGLGGFGGDLDGGDAFGAALAAPGDLNGDGVPDLVVGAPRDDDGGNARGAVWVLFLRRDGTVAGERKISAASGGFEGALRDDDRFGSALAAPGDLDGDGLVDLAVGSPGDDDAGFKGAFWLLFPRSDGTVRTQVKVSGVQGGLQGALSFGDVQGSALASAGDLDGDGVLDLIAGTPTSGQGGPEHGALWLFSLDGIATIDFEGGDDQARTPLEHGQALTTPGAFERTIRLASGGPNLGPAIFDSAPRRPGATLDGDLLVGLGNLCLLQDPDHPEQGVPGVFDLPEDAAHGGVLSISFRAPIEPRSVTLVALDDAFVRLIDQGGQRRVYRVPRGWTGELLSDGPPGHRTLDLTTLDPQRGHAAVVTALQDAGFDPRAVVELVLELHGEGALDDLRWDPHPGSVSASTGASAPAPGRPPSRR